MYCTKCELEIKGEDNDACPICDSPLVENSMEQQFSNVETPDDLKIRELIEDIDKTVMKNLEDNDKGTEFNLEMDDNEFKLELEDQAGDLHFESSEEQVFNLNDEGKDEPFESHINEHEEIFINQVNDSNEESFILKDETPERGDKHGDLSIDEITSKGIEVEKQTEDNMHDQSVDEKYFEEPLIDFSSKISSAPGKDEEEDSESTYAEESITTKEMLDKALDELDSTDEKQYKAKGQPTSKSFSVFMGITALLIIVIGGGLYYLNLKTENISVSEPINKITQKEDKVLTKLLGREDNPAVKKAEQPQQQVQPDRVLTEPLKEEKTTGGADVKTEVIPQEKIVTVESPNKAITEKKEQIKKTATEKKTETATERKTEIIKKKEVLPSLTYSIHAGSYRKKITAEKEAEMIKARGFDTYVESIDLTKSGNKGIWYRVKIGRFTSSNEAEKVQKELSRKLKMESRIIKNKQ